MAPKTSQQVIDDFWKKFITPSTPPTKASAILPKNIYAAKISKLVPQGATTSHPVSNSYDAAVASCKAKVDQIVRECLSINQRYTDPYFDLENRRDCLTPLYRLHNRGRRGSRSRSSSRSRSDVDSDDGSSFAPPPSVKRVTDIFGNPQFYVNGAEAKDIQQGYNGDCWFLSALMAICNLEENVKGQESLVERVCVKQDQDVGVYGFVLFRDGEWVSVIVDDKLYLRKPDYENCNDDVRREWEENRLRVNSEEEYRKEYQTNSRALWFAQSTHPDETWVPLLEKAYAKTHGDYGAIEGGWVGEGVEDLTGGASMNIYTENILSKPKFWEELKLVNKEYLFGCSSPWYDDPYMEGRNGLIGNHAYSILRAVEYKDEKLVLVKNPWGKTEWKGPWSDGSREWNSESIKDLEHTFGDDGIFWIRFSDLLKRYNQFYRTRLFTDEWRVTQQWVSCAIPWSGTYQDTKFELVVEKKVPMVVILSQLDERYFRGLVGQYKFDLSFRVANQGDDENYIIRTAAGVPQSRSIHTEITLDPSTYEVRLKIVGTRYESKAKVEDVVKENWLERREKLLRTGLSYDLAHAKAQVKEPKKEEEKPEALKAKSPVRTTVTKTTTTTTVTDFKDSKEKKTDDKKEKEKKKDDKKSTEVVVETEKVKVLKPQTSKDNIKVEDEPAPAPAPTPVDTADVKKDEGEKVESAEDKAADAPAIVDQPSGVPDAAEEAVVEEEKTEEKDKDDDASSTTSSSSSHSSADFEAHEKRWAAVAVVGLRVYSKDADVSIRVIRPELPTKASEKTKLDVDDPAKDASKAEGFQIEAEAEKPTEKAGEEAKEVENKTVIGEVEKPAEKSAEEAKKSKGEEKKVVGEEQTFLSEKSREEAKADETSTESAGVTPESSEGGEKDKKSSDEKPLVAAEPIECVPEAK